MASETADELYERHARAVFTTCLRILGDRDDAADAVHDVFLRALPNMAGIEHPAAWLQTVARRHCADIGRRRSSERGWMERAHREAAHHALDPELVAVQRDAIAAAVAALPQGERRVLLHSALLDAPLREVASRLSLSYAAAAQALSRARRRARAAVDVPAGYAAGVTRLTAHRVASLGERLLGRRGPAHAGLIAACTMVLAGSADIAVAHHPVAAPVAGHRLEPEPQAGEGTNLVARRAAIDPGRFHTRVSVATAHLRAALPAGGGRTAGWCSYRMSVTFGREMRGHMVLDESCPTTTQQTTARVEITGNGRSYGATPAFTCSLCTHLVTDGWSDPLGGGRYDVVATSVAVLRAGQGWAHVLPGCTGAGTPVMSCTWHLSFYVLAVAGATLELPDLHSTVDPTLVP